jgi:ATP synthase protein I
MATPEEPLDETLRRLDDRLEALQASQTRPRLRIEAEGSGIGYRLMAELVGGVLGGVGFGWLLDHFAQTSPFGLIGGLLIGSGASVFLVVRSAMAMGDAEKGKSRQP